MSLDKLPSDYKVLVEQCRLLDKPFEKDDHIITSSEFNYFIQKSLELVSEIGLLRNTYGIPLEPDLTTGTLGAYSAKLKSLELTLDIGAKFVASPGDELMKVMQRLMKVLFGLYHWSALERINKIYLWYRRNFMTAPTLETQGVSAVLRVKNELTNLKVNLKVLLSYFDEIVIIDHQSTDGTLEYIKSLHYTKLKVFTYSKETASADEFYTDQRKEGKGSLADFYNFCFEKAHGAYVCKWDADMYPLPNFQQVLETVRQGHYDVISFDGLDCHGMATTSPEPRLYRNHIGFRYKDADTCEILVTNQDMLPPESMCASTPVPVYLHMKFKG